MTPLVVGNWKMNTTLDDAQRLLAALLPGLRELSGVQVVLCPPAPWLVEVKRLVEDTDTQLGAQNIHYTDGGAFTGEVSARMLKGLCQYVLVGQYERRIFFDEKDGIVKRKLLAALQHGLKPILCVGETGDDLDENTGAYVVAQQLEAALEDVTLDSRLTIAYEPVWTTIGMVQPPPPSYGGSVGPRTIDTILAEGHTDGVLTGSASVNADTFLSIARAFAGATLRS